jgi:hypothetical protein
MEKLFNYLKQIEDFYFENLDSNFYKITNEYYIYKKLATKEELKKILNDNKDYTLINNFEFKVFRKHRLNLLSKGLDYWDFNKQKKEDEKLCMYIAKPSIPDSENPEDYINDKYVISISETEGKKFFTHEASYSSLHKGIVFLKKNRTSVKFEDKKFKNLDDLKNDPNIGLYVQELNNSRLKIICYDYSRFHDFFDENKDYVFPILFAGQISNDKDNKDLKFKEIPYKGAVINWTVAKNEISGRATLYPILASFARNSILISDRHSLSKFSKKVWENFFKNKEFFDKKFPIDNWKKPITIDDSSDDGILFNNDKYENEPYDPKKFKSMSKEKQKEELTKARLDDPYNWAYHLRDDIKVKADQIKNILIKRHEEIVKKLGDDFNKKINDLADDFFDKNVG